MDRIYIDNVMDDMYFADEADAEIAELKAKIIDMRTRCNKRFYEQLQEIRKLRAANMLQSQDRLL